MADISDEQLWTLDTLIKDPRPSGAAYSDDDVARLSFLSQDDIAGENLVFDPGQHCAPPSRGGMGHLNAPPIREEACSATSPSSSLGVAEAPRIADEDAVEEQDDVVCHLDSLPRSDEMTSGSAESILKSSHRSHHSDDTDHSFSFASEENDSPLPSPRMILRRLSDSAQASYQQRLEATLTGNLTKSLNIECFQKSDSMDLRQFTMDDLTHFDAQFGREAYLEQIGREFVDGSGSKSFVSQRKCANTFDSSSTPTDVIKEGWMVKRGEVVPSWHKRWFQLRRTPGGPMLSYAKDHASTAPTKIIELSSTSRCIVSGGQVKPSKENEFRVVTSADSARREYIISAPSHYEMTEWVSAIQAAINAGNRSTFEGSSDFQRIWNDSGISAFLLRYGIRKSSGRNHLQTRVLELNFAEQTITNTKRGETLTTLHFSDLLNVSLSSNKATAENFGIILDFNGRHRSWPIFLDTKEARDDLYTLLRKITRKEVVGADLELRCSRLLLKKGFMERKNIATDLRIVGPHATLKGRLFVCLFENSVVFYPEDADRSARPWYVVALKGLQVSCREDKHILVIGRLIFICSSSSDCIAWYNALVAAISLPPEIVQIEVEERAKIRNAFHSSVLRLRKLLKANVKPEVNGPPKDHKAIEMMMRKLWSIVFPGAEYTSNADTRWQEIGFQRGGPASDLRSSGLLGLYCLIYFSTHPSGEFQRILDRTRFGVSEGNMKNYPLAIACINVVAILTETLGFGDAGSHSEGSSFDAMKTYVRLISHTVEEQDEVPRISDSKPLEAFDTFEDIVTEADNHVFEEMFCLLFPILDDLFVEMGAGYMEFGQVVLAFRRRISIIFAELPRTMEELSTLASEPCTDTLVAPSHLAKLK